MKKLWISASAAGGIALLLVLGPPLPVQRLLDFRFSSQFFSLFSGASRIPATQISTPDGLSEIRAEKAPAPDFDSELGALSRMESRYREKNLVLRRKLPPSRAVRGGGKLQKAPKVRRSAGA